MTNTNTTTDPNDSTTTFRINSNETASTGTVYYDDALDIAYPLIVGLFVALILGWMVVRYKVANNKGSNYSGSIYCCPERCFTSLTRFRKRRVFPMDDKTLNNHRLSNSFNNSNHNNRHNRTSQVSIISNNELGASYENFRLQQQPQRKFTHAKIHPISEYPLRTLRRDTVIAPHKNNTSQMPSLFKFSIANFKTSFPNFQRNSTSDDLL